MIGDITSGRSPNTFKNWFISTEQSGHLVKLRSNNMSRSLRVKTSFINSNPKNANGQKGQKPKSAKMDLRFALQGCWPFWPFVFLGFTAFFNWENEKKKLQKIDGRLSCNILSKHIESTTQRPISTTKAPQRLA